MSGRAHGTFTPRIVRWERRRPSVVDWLHGVPRLLEYRLVSGSAGASSGTDEPLDGVSVCATGTRALEGLARVCLGASCMPSCVGVRELMSHHALASSALWPETLCLQPLVVSLAAAGADGSVYGYSYARCDPSSGEGRT